MQNLNTTEESLLNQLQQKRMLELEIERLAYDDPVAFADIYLGFNEENNKPLDGWQKKFLRSKSQRLALVNSRQSGKSTTTAVLALWEAIYKPKSVIVLDAPSLRQSQELMLKIEEFIALLPYENLVESDTKLSKKFSNGSRIVALPGSDKTTRGISAVTLLVIDEAAWFKDDVYHGMTPTLAVSNGRLILLSTPHGQAGFFFDEFDKGGDTWERFKVPATECPRIPKAFLDQELASMGSAYFNQEYMCEFVAAGVTRIQRSWLLDKYVDKVPGNTEIVMGVDLAISEKNTADYTAICVMGRDKDGNVYVMDVARTRESFRGQQNFINQYAAKWNPKVVAIENNAYQDAIVQELLTTTKLNIKGIRSGTDKVARLAPLEARYEAGQVYHMRGLEPAFEVELFGFPIAKNDDMVDAMTKAWAGLEDKNTDLGNIVPKHAVVLSRPRQQNKYGW